MAIPAEIAVDQDRWLREGAVLLIAGIVVLGIAQAATETEQYRFSVMVRTAEMLAPEVSASPLPGGVWQIEGTLSLSATHRNSDGSVGYRISLDAVDEKLSDKLIEGGSGLVGRSVGFRAFDDGEILDIWDGGQIAGWSRRGDLADLLVPLLSPAPPQRTRDGAGRRRMIWPFRVGTHVRWDNAVEAVWQSAEASEKSEVRTMTYAGPWQMDGWDKRPGGKLVLRGSGHLRGTVGVQADGVWHHRIRLKREIRITVGSAKPLVQEQEIVASVQRVGDSKIVLPRADDYSRPQPRYLDSATVQQAVQALPDAMSGCASSAEMTLPVEVKVGGDGRVSEVTSAQLPGCIGEALRAAHFSAHDAGSEWVRFTIYQRGGRLSVSPVAELVRVPVGPVLIHPLGAWSPQLSGTVAEALGHPLTAPKNSQR